MATTPDNQASRMRAAIGRAIAPGPEFLRGAIDADAMTETMVTAVRDYIEGERARGGDGAAHDPEAARLEPVLAELFGCGSGYRAGRCDAACVGRTMSYLLREFGTVTD